VSAQWTHGEVMHRGEERSIDVVMSEIFNHIKCTSVLNERKEKRK
jgi:hypothetical protein